MFKTIFIILIIIELNDLINGVLILISDGRDDLYSRARLDIYQREKIDKIAP